VTVAWAQDPDLVTWRAQVGGCNLEVTRLALDQWVPRVERRGVIWAGPNLGNRASAQRWCEQAAAQMRRELKDKTEVAGQ